MHSVGLLDMTQYERIVIHSIICTVYYPTYLNRKKMGVKFKKHRKRHRK